MNIEERPNPEALLAAARREERRKRKGNLKIFLGMSAGVGKTYRMLQEAQNLKKEGVNLIVGVVETHGRKETASLLEGLKSIPKKLILYKDITFEEFDLDEVLRLKPELVLVDELAHTNIPGSRHLKRWQDVVEILDNGINVYTTLNVQHIESLKDVLDNITGLLITETVPDLIIEAAGAIELIDITPEELLQRLKEGKVYLGDQSEVAAMHFFQEDRLTALREIVLRYAAEKVDHDLHDMAVTTERRAGWRTRERLLVAVSPSPHSQRLIRTARRLAFNLDAPWIALHVNDKRVLSEADNKMLSKNLALARELGAEVITITDPDIGEAIERIARQKGVTQIIIGRPPKGGFFSFFQSSKFLDRLARDCSDIDVHLIRQSSYLTHKGKWIRWYPLKIHFFPYFLVLCFTGLLAGITALAASFLDYRVLGSVFLVGILFLSLFVKKVPLFFGAVLFGLTWLFFFVPHNITIDEASKEDIVLFSGYFITAILAGLLSDRARINKEMLAKREESFLGLYEIVQEMASPAPANEVLNSVKMRLGMILDGTCEILIKRSDRGLIFSDDSLIASDEKERNAANWVLETGQEAGWSTASLPLSKNLYIPLKGFEEVLGVLAFSPKKLERVFTIEEKNFFYTVGRQLANYLQRAQSEERTREIEKLNQKEEIHQNILNVIIEKFLHPLKKIHDVTQELREEFSKGNVESQRSLIQKIENSTQNISRVLDNISVLSLINRGAVALQKAPHSLQEIVDAACANVKTWINHHHVKIDIPQDLPLLEIDFSLMKLLLSNILSNAFQYSPAETTVEITAKEEQGHLVISVLDEGVGIPQDQLDTIFEKFYQVPGTTKPGFGIGLTVCKAIAELHGGFLRAQNRPEKGARFSLFLNTYSG